MANPKEPQPEGKPSATAKEPLPPAAQETKRPTDSTPVASGTFAKLPVKFGRYQVEKLLGRGAMGAVYLARDTQLERLVALKIPKLSGSGAAKLLARLKTEAKAAAQIDHPSVCSVYDAGDIDGTSYIAMQYIEGETLREHLQKQTHTPAEVVNLMLHLAEGLAEAHSRGIYHRDLKPENIKLNRRGTPVIMDFGLAKLTATVSADAGKTQSGTILGSPAYMSPEQAGGKVEEIDHRSDLYALGVILFEMLTGQWPFTGGALQVMGQKSVLDPPTPLTIKPELNPQLAAVCHKLIAKKREDRYQTAQEVIAALKLLDVGPGTQNPAGSAVAGESEASDSALFPPFEQADNLSSLIARKRQEASRGGAVAKVGSQTRRITQSIADWWRGKSRPVKWSGVAAGVLAVGLVGLWAGGVFTNIKTKEGTLVIEVNEPGAEVFVDGEKAEVTWADGKMKATVQVKPGVRRVEVKKEGFSVAGRKITFKEGDREIFNARLKAVESIPQKQGAPQPAIAPFNAEEAKKHQSVWAKYLNLDLDYTNSIGMKFTLIPPGEFMMGSVPGEIQEALKLAGQDIHWQECIKSEVPQHKVILTQPVYLGVHEVTQGQYERVMGKMPSHFGPTGGGTNAVANFDTTSHPVEMVSWNEAAEFCAKLSQQEKLKPYYFRTGETVTLLDGSGYRLPTEAEWEHASRAGTTTKFWIGDKGEDLPSAGWFATNSGGRTHPVGELKANPFGLYDIHGNTWEWVQDAWEPTYYAQFQDKPALDPSGPFSVGSKRMIRGGDWNSIASNCRASYRHPDDAAARFTGIGFRVARVIDTKGGTSPLAATAGSTARPPNKPWKPIILAGTWMIVGDELAQTDADIKPDSGLLLSDQFLSEYDLKFKAKSVSEGVQKFCAIFHHAGNANYCRYKLGNWKNTLSEIVYLKDGKWKRIAGRGGPLETNRWYDVRISIRGGEYRAYLDGVEMFFCRDQPLTEGRIGLGTHQSAARFKDIEVTDPGGNVLWKGLPDLPSGGVKDPLTISSVQGKGPSASQQRDDNGLSISDEMQDQQAGQQRDPGRETTGKPALKEVPPGDSVQSAPAVHANDKKDEKAKKEIAFPKLPKGAGKIDRDAPKTFTATESGLKYRVLRKGKGKTPRATATVKVNYQGWLDNAKVFDSSYKRDEPISFTLNRVIKGWTEGMQLVGRGGMIELEIPSKLGYGNDGAPPDIPPNATLHFLVELIDVE